MGLESNVPKKSSNPDSSIRRQAHQPQVHCAFRQVSISWGSTSLTNTYIFDRRFILQHLFQLLLESSSSAHGLLGFLKTKQWQSGHERDSWWLFVLETGVKCWLRMPPLGQIQGSREGANLKKTLLKYWFVCLFYKMTPEPSRSWTSQASIYSVIKTLWSLSPCNWRSQNLSLSKRKSYSCLLANIHHPFLGLFIYYFFYSMWQINNEITWPLLANSSWQDSVAALVQ